MTLEAVHFPTYSLVLADRARVCPICQTMRYVWVNRDGETICYTCADLKKAP